MATIFVSSSRNYVVRGILTILTGGLLLFMPGLTMQTVMIVIGGMLLLSGTDQPDFFQQEKSRRFKWFLVIPGLLQYRGWSDIYCCARNNGKNICCFLRYYPADYGSNAIDWRFGNPFMVGLVLDAYCPCFADNNRWNLTSLQSL